jgi:chromosome segregation ATPase
VRNYWDRTSAFPSRAALFVRHLADEIAPANKIAVVVENLRSSDLTMPGDFTEQEKSLARILAPTDTELDAMANERISALKSELAEATKNWRSVSKCLHSVEAERDGANLALHLLREAYEALDLPVPSLEQEG